MFMVFYPELIIFKMQGIDKRPPIQHYPVGVALVNGWGFPKDRSQTGINVFTDGNNINEEDILYVVYQWESKEYLNEIKNSGRKYVIFYYDLIINFNRKEYLAGIYKEAEIAVLPVVVNSGLYWPKHTFIKKSGKIIIKFLKPIPPNLEKYDFLKKIESIIEKETNKII